MNAETMKGRDAVAGQVERPVRPDREEYECRECEGQGSYDAWKAVAGHYEGGRRFPACGRGRVPRGDMPEVCWVEERPGDGAVKGGRRDAGHVGREAIDARAARRERRG